MRAEQQMGEITQLAYNYIKEDLLVIDDELDPMTVLDFIQDGDHFKRIADLLKETMIMAGIPTNTRKLIKEYPTVSSFLSEVRSGKLDASVLSSNDSTNSFTNSLFALLNQQEAECLHKKRKKNWTRTTIQNWFSQKQTNVSSRSGTSESFKQREDAIAICFALGLDYPSSRDFLNKAGHAIFNIRDYEDAVYIYCLINHRPLSVAKKLIYEYSKSLDNFSNLKEESITHTGNTTLLLTNQILGDSNWETDEDFFSSFLLPNRANFISYSRTAMKEYYKIKNPIYLLALKKTVTNESYDFSTGRSIYNLRKIQEYIHKLDKEIPIDIPISSVQVTYNFINNLRKYSTSSNLLKIANDMLDIHVERLCPGNEEENFKTVNNSLDVIDYIINNYASYSNDEKELATISEFLTKTVTAYRMLDYYFPSLVYDECGKDSRQRSYSRSITSNEYIDTEGRIRKKDVSINENLVPLRHTVLRSFPHRGFFTQFENHPERLIHDFTLRKSMILLFYMNYARNLMQEISSPNSTGEEMAFGFEDFYESMNTILGKCQLGKLYYANPFDWLILESIVKLQTYSDYDDKENPVSFLDKVIDYSFGPDYDDDDDD